MSQWAKFLLLKHEDMNSVPSRPREVNTVVHIISTIPVLGREEYGGWEDGACWLAHLAI